MSTANAATISRHRSYGFVDRQARRLVMKRLESLQQGHVRLTEGDESWDFGDIAERPVTLCVNHSRFYRDAVLGGTLSVAEAYLRGDWDCDDLTSLFRTMIRNETVTTQWDRGFARLQRVFHQVYHRRHANTRDGSRRNIAAHYDLGNDFFRLMLDDTMAYSSGIFPGPHSGLQDSSVEKIDRACRKLDLQPHDHLLEIGTGWGGLAVHAAQNYGCRVTTTTISQQQYEVAQQRIAAAGLSDRVTLLLQDYRDLDGQYDKLVSIEMIEAVGYRFFDDYFRQCSRLLKPDGTFVLQAITMPEQRYDEYLSTVDFIQRYVFPGGCLPSQGAMLKSVARATDFRCVHLEDFGPHYARTLREWRKRFHERLPEVRQLGYDERFVRLWDYYLCYCEAAFEERCTGVVQVQFDKPLCRRDPLQIGAATHRIHSSN